MLADDTMIIMNRPNACRSHKYDKKKERFIYLNMNKIMDASSLAQDAMIALWTIIFPYLEHENIQ